MSQPGSPEQPSGALDGVIARSRSRYKTNRSDQIKTNTHAPPKIRHDLLERHSHAVQGTRPPELNAETSKSNITSLTVSHGVAEDEFNCRSTPPNNNCPPAIPSGLANRRAQTFPEDKPTQYQTPQHSSSQLVAFSPPRSRQQITNGRINIPHSEQRSTGQREIYETRNSGPDHAVAQDTYAKTGVRYTKPRSGHVEDVLGQAEVHPLPHPASSFEPLEHSGPRKSHSQSLPTSGKPSTLQKRSLTHRRKASDVRDELKRSISAPMAVEPPDVTTKPAFDAPVSAVNAGDRRIRVHFEQNILSIPVTPSTTPLDVIREAGSQLSMPIDTTANVLMECFKQLGLERPLRRYERVRDVMNSWDHDSQNSLNVIPSPTGGKDADLDLASVAPTQPNDTSVHIYHSNAPGHWDKRWVTLRADGQVLMTKKDGKETVNICHLSDFDIYVPTKRQIAKKIKPPKKYCFAVKSQQKSAMFLSTENFVHFFAAGDRELAMAWYKAVQEWRSWYLVNVLGEGQKADYQPSIPQQSVHGCNPNKVYPESRTLGDPKHAPKAGEPLPLPKSRSLSTNQHVGPPLSSRKELTKDATSGMPTNGNEGHYRASIIRHQPSTTAQPEPFAAQSLLGRTYTQRQKAVVKGTQESAQEYSPLGGHAGGAVAVGDGSPQRRSTQKPRNKPLIDLTPKHQEPPQHRKKTSTFPSDHLPAGGLIEAATNTDPTVTNPLEKRGLDTRKSSITQAVNMLPTTSPEKRGPAFTGGLLSSVQIQSQNGSGTGHGVRTGDRAAKEPLLDMTIEGPWAKGSLLDRVDSAESGHGPPVDREKRLEMDAPVGEGL